MATFDDCVVRVGDVCDGGGGRKSVTGADSVLAVKVSVLRRMFDSRVSESRLLKDL